MQEKKAYKLLLQSIILRKTTDVYNTYVSESKLVAAVTASSSSLILRGYVLEKTVSQLEKILKSPGCKKVPLRIKDEDDAVTAATNFDSDT
jgi:GTPase